MYIRHCIEIENDSDHLFSCDLNTSISCWYWKMQVQMMCLWRFNLQVENTIWLFDLSNFFVLCENSNICLFFRVRFSVILVLTYFPYTVSFFIRQFGCMHILGVMKPKCTTIDWLNMLADIVWNKKKWLFRSNYFSYQNAFCVCVCFISFFVQSFQQCNDLI